MHRAVMSADEMILDVRNAQAGHGSRARRLRKPSSRSLVTSIDRLNRQLDMIPRVAMAGSEIAA